MGRIFLSQTSITKVAVSENVRQSKNKNGCDIKSSSSEDPQISRSSKAHKICAVINVKFYCMRRPNKQSCFAKRNYNAYKTLGSDKNFCFHWVRWQGLWRWHFIFDSVRYVSKTSNFHSEILSCFSGVIMSIRSFFPIQFLDKMDYI